MLKNINRKCRLSKQFDLACILNFVLANPETIVITISKEACVEVNDYISHKIFENEVPIAYVCFQNRETDIPLYKNQHVLITMNRDKKLGVVNGQPATIISFEGQTIIVKLKNGNIAPIYMFTDAEGKTFYPLSLMYALTIAKIQGQTLPKVIVYLDTPKMNSSTTYVALSRVKKVCDLKLAVPLRLQHFQ